MKKKSQLTCINKIALVVLTIPNYHHEAHIIINRINELGLDSLFTPYVASCNLEDFIDLEEQGWSLIHLDKISTWGSDMISVLNSINEEFIFIMLDDFYPYNISCLHDIYESLNQAISFNPNTIRFTDNFNSRLFPRKITRHISFERYAHRYITSLVFPIFKTSFLNYIVQTSDSPWSFEKNARFRFDFQDESHLIIPTKINAINLVVKGESLRSSFRKANMYSQNNLFPNPKHPLMSHYAEYFYHFKRFCHRLIMKYDFVSFFKESILRNQ